MKNLSLILNGVLFVGLIVLYVLFFTQKKQAVPQSADIDTLSTEIPSVEGGIVIVKMDTIYQKYQMALDLSNELQNEVQTSEARLSSNDRKLKKDAQEFQRKVERQLITRADAEKEQQELMMRQQELMQEQQKLQYELAEKQQVMQNQVMNEITEYLRGIEAENNFRVVIGTAYGGSVLYTDPELDITRQVINGLNAEYRTAKEK